VAHRGNPVGFVHVARRFCYGIAEFSMMRMIAHRSMCLQREPNKDGTSVLRIGRVTRANIGIRHACGVRAGVVGRGTF